MQREEFEAMKGLDVITVKKVKTYRASIIVTLILLFGVILATFKYSFI